MATLFLSYSVEDREMAKQLKEELKVLGHTIRVDTDIVSVGSRWRDGLMKALTQSDAVVALISERSAASPSIILEIGAARALGQTGKRMVMLPVIVGDMPIPQFIQDIYAIRVRDADPECLKLAAIDIDKAIRAHLAQIENIRGAGLKLSAGDATLEVVHVLRSAINGREEEHYGDEAPLKHARDIEIFRGLSHVSNIIYEKLSFRDALSTIKLDPFYFLSVSLFVMGSRFMGLIFSANGAEFVPPLGMN